MGAATLELYSFIFTVRILYHSVYVLVHSIVRPSQACLAHIDASLALAGDIQTSSTQIDLAGLG